MNTTFLCINRKIDIIKFEIMNLKFVKTALVLLLSLQAKIINCYPAYTEYVQKFEKHYKNSEEYQIHEKAYNDRIANFATQSSYTYGVNPMSDLLPQQIQLLKNLRKEDVNTRLARPLPLTSRLGYPASLDWRDSNAVTQIKNQGFCGACWAFATAAYVQSKLIIAKRFTKSNIDLSQQYLVSCTPQSGCNGGYFEKSFRQAVNLPSQKDYPYSPYRSQSSNICSAKGVVAGDSNADYYNLADAQLIDLLQKGPVAISINSDGWVNYGSGTYECYNSQVNHAVLLIGYTSDYWIIKNQWGSLWGMEGFMKISRIPSKNCGIGYSAHVLLGEGNSANDKYYTTDSNGTASNTLDNLGLSQNSYRTIALTALLLLVVLHA